MGDFRVEIKVKNGRLYRAIRGAGFSTVAAFCNAFGLRQGAVGALLGMKISPLRKDRSDWTKTAYDLSSALHLEPEELWPAHMRHLTANGDVVCEMNLADLAALPQSGSFDTTDLPKLLAALPDRPRRMIEARYLQGDTLTDVARDNGVTVERIRQIEHKALRRMREKAKRLHLMPVA